MPQQHSVLVHPPIAIALQRWVPLGNKPHLRKCLANTVSILMEFNINKLTFILYLPIALFYTHKYIAGRKTHAWNAEVLCFPWTPAPASTVESRAESTAVEHTQHIQHISPYRLPKKSIKPQTWTSVCLTAPPLEKKRLSWYIILHTQKVNDFIFSPGTCFKKIIWLFPCLAVLLIVLNTRDEQGRSTSAPETNTWNNNS